MNTTAAQIARNTRNAEIVSRYHDRESSASLSEYYNLSQSHIRQIVRENLGITREQALSARNTRNAEIMSAYRMGTPAKKLAQRYRLSPNYINHLMYEKRAVYGSNTHAIPLADTIEKVCNKLKVSKVELLSGCRRPPVVRARFAIYILARLQDFTYAQIARRLGMHHTTIMSGVRRAQALRENDAEFDKLVRELQT